MLKTAAEENRTVAEIKKKARSNKSKANMLYDNKNKTFRFSQFPNLAEASLDNDDDDSSSDSNYNSFQRKRPLESPKKKKTPFSSVTKRQRSNLAKDTKIINNSNEVPNSQSSQKKFNFVFPRNRSSTSIRAPLSENSFSFGLNNQKTNSTDNLYTFNS